MPNLILRGYIIATDADLPSVQAELPNHIALTRKEPGCLVFEVLQSANNKNKFTVYEEFDSKCSFDLHQRRVADSAWGKVSKDLERHYEVEGLD